MLTSRLIPLLMIAVLCVMAGGCAHTSVLTPADKILPADGGNRVLLMSPDIELYEMTMSGLLEPKADWTASAIENVTEAIKQTLATHHNTMANHKMPAENSHEFNIQQQLIKLHEVVGESIMRHQYPTIWKLPTKENNFEWTLGRDVVKLKDEYGAQYGLFVYMRDSYASPERMALWLGMAALGVGLPLGRQDGFASLVDLQTGNIVWFNRMFSGSGDLRTVEFARDSIHNLLTDFPL